MLSHAKVLPEMTGRSCAKQRPTKHNKVIPIDNKKCFMKTS
jgi:hypothetical protein